MRLALILGYHYWGLATSANDFWMRGWTAQMSTRQPLGA